MARKSLVAVVVLSALVFLSGSALSEPRFALRNGSRCDVCHVNPTGGGMRNDYGALYYAMEELPMPELKKKIGAPAIDRDLSKNVQFGSDFRTFYYYSRWGLPSENSFFQMQGDLYFNLTLNDYLSAYFRKGFYSDFEGFGMVKLSKIDTYVKFGRINPPYGLKIAEHDAFIRDSLSLSPYLNDTGVEFGFEPKSFSFALGVFNGTSSMLDDNRNKAIYFRGLCVASLMHELKLLLGTSVRNMKKYVFPEDQNYTSWAGYGGFSFSKVTFLTEADWVSVKDHDQTMVFTEGSLVLVKGIDLRMGYEYFKDKFPTGSEKIERLNFGIALFPLPSSELQAKYRFHTKDSSERDRLFLALHLFM